MDTVAVALRVNITLKPLLVLKDNLWFIEIFPLGLVKSYQPYKFFSAPSQRLLPGCEFMENNGDYS